MPGARWIPLTRGLFTLVDEADYADLVQWNWHTAVGGTSSKPYAMRGEDHLPMHRYLMGAKPDEQVDHRDGNGLDNRRKNLRSATTSQNGMNTTSKGGTSKYKGVSWSNRSAAWIAEIKVMYKKTHLGVFASEEDAARAYDAAARQLHGEFARLNFPDA